MHPPTALSFVKHQIALFEQCNVGCSASTRHDIGELARFLCELSVCDYFFVTKKPSAIAVAALYTAMDHIDKNRLPTETRALYLSTIRDVACLDVSSSEVRECRSRLDEMYRQGSYGGHNEDDRKTPNFVGDVR